MTTLTENSFGSYSLQYELRGTLIISLLIHLVFLSILVYIPDFRRIEIRSSQVISVDLVTLPRYEPALDSSGKLPDIKPSPSAEKKKIKVQESRESEKMAYKKEEKKEKDKEKKKLKDKPKEKPLLSSDWKADEKMEKAIEKIKQGLLAKREEDKAGIGMTEGGKGTGLPVQMQGGKSGVVPDVRFQIYYSIIWSKIKDAWVLPENLASGDKRLEAIVAIRIKKDGEIIKVWVEKSSGNIYFDQSALRAIAKANPLPPVPEGYTEEFFELGIRFLPSEQ